MTAGASHNEKPNHLFNESSPYLLQHAYNPVDWYPWSDLAFGKAKEENKPIFLSIGYSSCHWCHVMAHESFEDKDVANFLNENFVSIKVDREERPDVDEIYIKAVMRITGSAGWPLTVFLTPSLEPIYGGTYFPPTPSHGMPSFISLARNISNSWKKEKSQLVETASQLTSALKELYDIRKNENTHLDEKILDECYGNLATSFDEVNGGFGVAPKFPTPTNLFFLSRYSKREPASLALSMLTKTLDAMMEGGIYDQVGAGFHRYSTDRFWLVPHFEKMLSDNALLSQVYTEAYLITKREDYVRIVRETLSWVLREMRSPEGGFYSAQDADTADGEGAYYVWDLGDLRLALGEEKDLKIVADHFSITSEGNFEDGKTILTTKSVEKTAQKFGLGENKVLVILENAKRSMLAFRNRRSHPSTDDKIVTSWNGLMISALSRASNALGDKSYLEAALSSADHILKQMTAADEGKLKLFRSYKGGARGDGVLEDYSFIINGLIDLYEACFEPSYLENALKLCESMIEKFHDSVGGGFFLTDSKEKDLIVRPKDAYDGASPSGNSMAALACARLAEITGKDELENAATDTLEAFWKSMSENPTAFTAMTSALQFHLGGTRQIVISGNPEAADLDAFLKVLRSEFIPNSVVIFADKRLESITKLVEDRISSNENVKVYVCSNYACKLPSLTPEELKASLSDQMLSGQ